MNTGPRNPSRSAAASITATYSAGRWSVYAISERAISRMNAPALIAIAVRKIARAVSYVTPRTLIAGTVKPCDLAAAARHVQVVDRRRLHADRLPELPDQPARVLALHAVGEDGRAHELIHRRAGERVRAARR